MFRRRALAALALFVLGALASCDSGGEAEPPQSPRGEENPTLNDDTQGGSPPNSATDDGSGTGSGRGTP